MTGITVFGCDPDEADAFRRLGPRLGVVPTIVDGDPTPETVAAVPGHRCASVGHRSVVSRDVLRALHDAGVEHLTTRSIGFDHIDLDAAGALGITVENVVYGPDGVADFTVMLILMAIRGAGAILDAAADGDLRLPRTRGRDLCDLTVGVVGAGHVGTAVIRRLEGFGCRVLAHDRSPVASAPRLAASFVTLPELLRRSDVVTLHLPLDDRTRHLIGPEQIAAMGPGAVIVNTGRGALVDTAALVAALESGRLGGAALDVIEGEDGIFSVDHRGRPIDHALLRRLLRLPNVIVTPHTAFHTRRTLHDTVEETLIRCLTYEGNGAHGEETDDRHRVRRVLGGA
jgi:D-specific alpha-keto acid dehydrogenase